MEKYTKGEKATKEQILNLSIALNQLDANETQELIEFINNYVKETKQEKSYSTRNYFLNNPSIID